MVKNVHFETEPEEASVHARITPKKSQTDPGTGKMRVSEIKNRKTPPEPWREGDNIPWSSSLGGSSETAASPVKPNACKTRPYTLIWENESFSFFAGNNFCFSLVHRWNNPAH